MEQSITLNIPFDSSEGDWEKIANVYKSLDGWIDGADWPCWYGQEGDPQYVIASSEPSGLLFTGALEPDLWAGWISVLCSRLSLALGREVHDAEM